jgi:hypothetical protein
MEMGARHDAVPTETIPCAVVPENLTPPLWPQELIGVYKPCLRDMVLVLQLHIMTPQHLQLVTRHGPVASTSFVRHVKDFETMVT